LRCRADHGPYAIGGPTVGIKTWCGRSKKPFRFKQRNWLAPFTNVLMNQGDLTSSERNI
jgi:hypothetical protein